MTRIDWSQGTWLNPPAKSDASSEGLVVTTADQSDFWNRTGYGFVHDNGHALLRDFPARTAMEIEFSADWTHEFDQAGLFLYADPEHWVKAGVEFADGVLGLGAVVTDGMSDWSVGHVPEWMNARIRVRVSRTEDAITVRARANDEPWRLVRLAPINPTLAWSAGPLAASPSRAGLEVTFHLWETATPDAHLH